MLRRAGFLLVACLIGLGASAPASAGDVSVYRWELTDLDGPGLGGFASALLVGPGGGTVVNTRFIVEFVTLDAWDAAGVEIGVIGPIEQPDGTIGARAEVTGADFGWSGQGHFDTVYYTKKLNGPVIPIPGGNSSLWSMHLNDFSNFYFGQIQKLRIELDVEDMVADDTCPGDLDGDNELQPSDLAYFQLGECLSGDPCPADLNNDGIVTQADRNILISLFGNICPVAP